MQNVLITGANRGLGLELTRHYLTAGDRVFAGCREPQSANELKDLKGELQVLPLDVTDDGSVTGALETVSGTIQHLDILINNAGTTIKGESLENLCPTEMLKVFDVNTVGPIRVLQKFAPLLKSANNGRVINISSQLGSITQARAWGQYSYNASKAALNMHTRRLAADSDSEGMIIISLHPGWVKTRMGGAQAPLSPQQSAAQIAQVVEGLTARDHGTFLTHSGEKHPW